MQVVLQVLGGLFLLIILGIVVVVLVLRRQLRKFGQSLADMTSLTPPAELNLQPEENPPWSNGKIVRKHADALLLHGFQDEGSFCTQEMTNLFIQGFVHPTRNLFAAVYDHPQGGIVVDIVQKTLDGRTLTLSNTTQGEELDSMDGKKSIRLKDATVDQLMTAWQVDKLRGDNLPAPPGSFKECFEAAYREEMQWRIARGGQTPEEIHRIALASGDQYSSEIEEMTFQLQRRQANSQLHEILTEKYLKESGVSAFDWQSEQQRLTIIHDNLTREEVEELLSVVEEDREECFQDRYDRVLSFELPEMPARDAFAAVNATFPDHLQFKMKWQCDEPIAADYYLEPEENL